MSRPKILCVSKTISQDNKNAWGNPWVFAIAGTMATFIIVNIIFVITAFVTNPGLVVEDYYEKGREYEKNALKMLAATQATRHWETKLDMPKIINLKEKIFVTFTAVDELGLPVRDAQATLVAYRPSDAAADIQLPMQEIAPGLFQTALTLPLKGLWDIRIILHHHSDKLEIEKRISVKA
ncbi:MAG: FixH family protein [Gammaproteobacteria bacterium]|nr:FixH family protein [Gammaproteobacteria bacterium]MDH5729308.1 FixH family protein [Gammaproteobacteria bacterium]